MKKTYLIAKYKNTALPTLRDKYAGQSKSSLLPYATENIYDIAMWPDTEEGKRCINAFLTFCPALEIVRAECTIQEIGE